MQFFNLTDALTVVADTPPASASTKVRALQGEHSQPFGPALEWTAVETCKPSQSGHYLVLLRGRRHRLMEYDARSATFFPRSLAPVVSHWMQPPPPPGNQSA